jgi:putative RecB family exonuclease
MDDVAAPNELPVSRLSPSGAGTFRQCPRRWRLRYVERLPDPPTEAALRGSFAHRVLEELLAAAPGERSVEQARALARELWPEVEADEHYGALGYDADAARGFRWRAWRAIEGYFRVEDPDSVDVVEREQLVECELAGVPFVGVVDRVDRVEGELVVTDYKSGRAPIERYEADRLGQVLLYAAALGELGVPVRRVRLLYLGQRAVEAPATAEDLAPAVEALGATWQAIADAVGSDDFPPRPGPLCAWCPFAAACPEGRLEVERRYGRAA